MRINLNLIGFKCDHFVPRRCRHFTKIFNSEHGNCYVFNAGWDGDTRLENVTRPGRRHALHVIADPLQDEQIIWNGESGGIVIVVHPQERMPFPEDEGIILSPGRSTSISMTKARSIIILSNLLHNSHNYR